MDHQEWVSRTSGKMNQRKLPRSLLQMVNLGPSGTNESSGSAGSSGTSGANGSSGSAGDQVVQMGHPGSAGFQWNMQIW
jgi:hypothetical protein